MSFSSEGIGLKTSALNKPSIPKIYLCEFARTVSQVTSLKSEVCDEFAKLMSSESVTTLNADKREIRSSKYSSSNYFGVTDKEVSRKDFEVEIDVSVSSSDNYKTKKHPHTSQNKVKTPDRNVFEIETGSDMESEAETEVIFISSCNNEIGRFSDSISENLMVEESDAHFTSDLQDISKVSKPEYYISENNRGDKNCDEEQFQNLKSLLNFVFMKDIIASFKVNNQQIMRYAGHLTGNETLNFDSKPIFSILNKEWQTPNNVARKIPSHETNVIHGNVDNDLDEYIEIANAGPLEAETIQDVDPSIIMSRELENSSGTSLSSNIYVTCSTTHMKREDLQRDFLKSMARKDLDQNVNTRREKYHNNSYKIKKIFLKSAERKEKEVEVEIDDSLEYSSNSSEVRIPLPSIIIKFGNKTPDGKAVETNVRKTSSHHNLKDRSQSNSRYHQFTNNNVESSYSLLKAKSTQKSRVLYDTCHEEIQKYIINRIFKQIIWKCLSSVKPLVITDPIVSKKEPVVQKYPLTMSELYLIKNIRDFSKHVSYNVYFCGLSVTEGIISVMCHVLSILNRIMKRRRKGLTN